MLSLIAAVADDRAIGKDNQLPWHLSGDLKRFKEITAGHPIIMGRKTFLSLGRVLPKRHHYVLTGDPSYSYEHDRVTVCRDASELFKQAGESEEEWFVIGGASVYE
ncbi:MAG: dihydrofolate reductase, partial [Lachnospiraceae bacterium]|nr:dihydrofolate reductase [Lachnospiraceae bacterium]